MRILLLDFHHYKATAANLKTQNSLTLMQLASLIPDKHQVIAIDNPNELDLTKNYDLVAISTITPSAFDAYKIADEYRSRGTKVVIGGWHATALPNEAKEHADAVLLVNLKLPGHSF